MRWICQLMKGTEKIIVIVIVLLTDIDKRIIIPYLL